MASSKSTPLTTGSILGGVLLIAGCCIGVGMLGLPVQSGLAGFKPSMIMLVLAWLFMLTTGLFFLEVNLWFDDEVSYITLAGKTLGKAGKAVVWALFLFLFYSVTVAYIAGSGGLITHFIDQLTGHTLPLWAGSTLCVLVFGIFVYLGTAAVDKINRLLMLGLGITYLLLISIGLPHVQAASLEHQDWKIAPLLIPALIISFGFHNLIPTLVTYLNHDVKKLRLTLIIGSILPFIIYFFWELVILGIIPPEEQHRFAQALNEGGMATQALRDVGNLPWITTVTDYFAFFVIITSFLGVTLSFIDFLADGLHIKQERWGRLFLCLLVLVPPLFFAIIYPYIFLTALNYAGSFGAAILFGIIPPLMVWNGRYRNKMNQAQLVPGGRPVILLVILCAIAVVVLQAVREFS
jgi:tyrosine-specific transport protein